MVDSLCRSAEWREQRYPYSTAESSIVQWLEEDLQDTLRFSAAVRLRAWLQRHVPALVGQIGLDDVQFEEDGYHLTCRAAEAAWRYPNLTPGTYFSMGWSALDPEGQLASALVRSWAQTYPRSPAIALAILRGAARIETLLEQQPDPLPIERWFFVEDHLDEEALEAFCNALTTFQREVGHFPDLRALHASWHVNPTHLISLAATWLSPLHAEGGAVPGYLSSWFLRHLVSCAEPAENAERQQEATRQGLLRMITLLRSFRQQAWGHLPVRLEAEVQRAASPGDLERYLQRLVSETLPTFLQASDGKRLPLVLLEALPAPLDATLIRTLAERFSWSTWKRLLGRFQDEHYFDLSNPPGWVVQGICALLLTFGTRWHDWDSACQRKQGWGVYEASHWLPLRPVTEGLEEWLLRHVETAQERLAWVAKHWQDAGFPRAGTLAQMRVWELSGALRKDVPGVPEGVVEQLLPLMEYDLEPSVLCAAVQRVLPALRGEIVVDRRLVGGFEREEGRTIRFLAKTDPLGLALGEATHCCQQWGGVGQACMEAGYLRPDSTFLVLEQGANILAQAWVWIGSGPEGEALVLDNIEIPQSPRLSPNDVVAVVRAWAREYAEQTDLGVKLGTGSADYQLVDLVSAPSSQLNGYSGYTDATYQRWLALPPALAHLPAGVRRATELDGHALNTLERAIYPALLCTGVEVPSGDRGFALLYEEEGQPLGYLIVQVGYDWQEHGEGYAEDLAVLPAARRRAAMPLAEAFRRYATAYGLTHLYAHLRETTSHKLLKRHGERLGLVIEREDGWEERACGERFMPTHIRIVPGV